MTGAAALPRPSGAGRYLGLLARYGIVWVTVALFVLLALTTDGFLTGPNLRNVLDQQATLLIAASVATLTMIAGGFDVSIAAVAVAAPLVALRVENATGSVALARDCGLCVRTHRRHGQRFDRGLRADQLVHHDSGYVVHRLRNRLRRE